MHFFNKVKGVGKCPFDLEGTFKKNKKSRMLAHATLTLQAFFDKVKDVDKCNFDLEGTSFLKQVQGC